MLSKQETYDRVKAHLLQQNTKSASEGTCLYRGPNNTKCAVGCLIPDELYTSEIESIGAHSMFKEKNLLHRILYASNVNTNDSEIVNLLNELQKVHDYGAISQWREQLKWVALSFGLTP